MSEARPFPATTRGWLLKLTVVTLLAGVGAGIGGGLLALILHTIEHLAFHYDSGTLLQAASRLQPWQRFLPVAIAGVIGAVGWFALRRWGTPVVSVSQAVSGTRMPWAVTLLNALLQIVIVGLGASIGREVAPREVGALVSGWLADRAGLTPRERRIIVACGAGAGLAAVYSVPFGGALFTIEVLLAEISVGTVIPAFVAAGVATVVASAVVPHTAWYRLPQYDWTWSLLVWAVIAGPLLGLGAAGFTKAVAWVQDRRPRGWGILIVMPLVFVAVGLLAAATPAVLGNGRALGQLAFDGTLTIGVMALLTMIKVVATGSTIGAGAAGGTLTPSLAIGAGLGAVGGGLWMLLWPGSHLGAFALVGAAAFLASTMRAPMTGLVLVVEFTQNGTGLLVPLVIAVAGAVSVEYVMGRRRLVGVP
jgi:H+/Cl- antiporter ClcA